jgi:RNA polymerase sigma factor (sigma-70 family)
MGTDDSVLWQRAANGDVEAFAILFRRHADTIYNYCFRRIGDWAAAEDLLSIVFLEAWRRRNKHLPEGKVLPWLYGVATNVVHNRRRAERRFAAALARLPAPPPEPDFGQESDRRLDEELQVRSALDLLSQLPRHEQDVFALCAWHELSYADAALALEVPVGTIRSRLSRARRHLREATSAHQDNQGQPTTPQEVSAR